MISGIAGMRRYINVALNHLRSIRQQPDEIHCTEMNQHLKPKSIRIPATKHLLLATLFLISTQAHATPASITLTVYKGTTHLTNIASDGLVQPVVDPFGFDFFITSSQPVI